ncbi:MAG TPA: DedA family protein, partial [Burkholderiales bacterium]|nr:DedA family protein [Burkholderiales bacterium]
TSSIRPWMTLGYVSAAYHAPEPALLERLGLPATTDPKTSLRTLAQRAGASLLEYLQRVQQAVARVAPHSAAQGASGASTWLGALGDRALGAVLAYGYPALAITILLGSLGLPLPDGFATTMAGSLAAQGRMDWLYAGEITLAAAVLGDVVAYGLGRVLGRGVLERHGRWIGYTAQRAVRTRLLFERWGSLSVLVTRTFVSYLSAAVSVLAGAGRYRAAPFFAWTLLGRLLWTSAYLGLGYGIGTDLQAAADFLKNLSVLMLSLAVLVGSGLVTFNTRPAPASSPPQA